MVWQHFHGRTFGRKCHVRLNFQMLPSARQAYFRGKLATAVFFGTFLLVERLEFNKFTK